MGANVDPDTARSWQIPKLVSNMAGQYGLIAASAYAAGAAKQAGRPVGRAALTEGFRNIPLPSKQLLEDSAMSGLNYGAGMIDNAREGKLPLPGPAHPNAEYWAARWLPRALMPTMLSDRNLENYIDNAQEFQRTFQLNFD